MKKPLTHPNESQPALFEPDTTTPASDHGRAQALGQEHAAKRNRLLRTAEHLLQAARYCANQGWPRLAEERTREALRVFDAISLHESARPVTHVSALPPGPPRR